MGHPRWVKGYNVCFWAVLYCPKPGGGVDSCLKTHNALLLGLQTSFCRGPRPVASESPTLIRIFGIQNNSSKEKEVQAENMPYS